MFAALVFENEPLQWKDLPYTLQSWVQNVGGMAAVLLVVGLLFYLLDQSKKRSRTSSPELPGSIQPLLMGLCAVGSVLGYAVAVLAASLGTDAVEWVEGGLSAGGGCSLAAVFVPFVASLLNLRWRRIWAIAQVSFREAVRGKVLWAFVFILAVYLFGKWFLPSDDKPEDQVRSYVDAVSTAMAILLLVPAMLVSAFGIPNDVSTQTIHTIVTKPVERFEIFIGRFLGVAFLFSLVLVGMTGLSLVYIAREVSEEAKQESLKARVPLLGELIILPKGENVGREWEYRSYIPGGDIRYKAIWSFRNLPRHLAERTEAVPCEFTFDIFRTTKGVDERFGVACTFVVQSWRFDKAKVDAYAEESKQRRGAAANEEEKAKIDEELAEKYGYYELKNKQIEDYHTGSFPVPVGVFKHALAGDEKPGADLANPGQSLPWLQVIVRCDSRTQYVGMARRDLYLLDAERPVILNFFKGAGGLWMLLCMVIGLATAVSTYLSGVISFLVVVFLFVAGMNQGYIAELAQGASIGGGPAESGLRLVRGVQSPSTPIDATPGLFLAQNLDKGSQVLFRWLKMIVPDVNTFDLSEYVAEGFDIPFLNFAEDDLLLKFTLLLGYLLPWSVVAFYLLKWREVAS